MRLAWFFGFHITAQQTACTICCCRYTTSVEDSRQAICALYVACGSCTPSKLRNKAEQSRCCRCMASIKNSRQATWGLCEPRSSFVDWGPHVGLAEPAHIPPYAVPGGKCATHGWLCPNTEGCCSWPHSCRSEELSRVHELQPSLVNPFVCSHSCIFPMEY